MLETRLKVYEKVDEECLKVFKNNFLNIIKSQNGSRVLQKSLIKTSKDVILQIFKEIKNSLQELLVDSYANYFCQRFYDFLEISQRIEFLFLIKNNIVSISNSTIGTYPLQAIIDQMKTNEERQIIIEAVQDHILEMCQVR
jgi:hypothetical protein